MENGTSQPFRRFAHPLTTTTKRCSGQRALHATEHAISGSFAPAEKIFSRNSFRQSSLIRPDSRPRSVLAVASSLARSARQATNEPELARARASFSQRFSSTRSGVRRTSSLQRSRAEDARADPRPLAVNQGWRGRRRRGWDAEAESRRGRLPCLLAERGRLVFPADQTRSRGDSEHERTSTAP